MSPATLRLLGVAAFMSISAAEQANSQTIKEIFEKYDLIGTFAVDCNKPPDARNWYFVNRVAGDNQIQRDYMTSRSNRAWFVTLIAAKELKLNELGITGIADGKPTTGVWRLGFGRMQHWESILDGKKLVAEGKDASNGAPLPMLTKCANPG
jgi:hypothetical protein